MRKYSIPLVLAASIGAAAAFVPAAAEAAAVCVAPSLARAVPSSTVEQVQYYRRRCRRVCRYNPYQPGAYRCRVVC